MNERTFSIIKPNAVAAANTGKILDRILVAGFTIEQMRMVHLTRAQAEEFYAIHHGRPFFEPLIEFMTSGKIVILELSKHGGDVIADFRTLVGATDPAKAAPDTLRALYGENVTRNAIHASDSPQNAEHEAAQFFPRK